MLARQTNSNGTWLMTLYEHSQGKPKFLLALIKTPSPCMLLGNHLKIEIRTAGPSDKKFHVIIKESATQLYLIWSIYYIICIASYACIRSLGNESTRWIFVWLSPLYQIMHSLRKITRTIWPNRTMNDWHPRAKWKSLTCSKEQGQ